MLFALFRLWYRPPPGRAVPSWHPGSKLSAHDQLNALYAEHWEYVLRVARYHCARRDVEDVAQAAWLVVYRRIAEYDPARSAKPWLFGVVRRCAADLRRARQRHPEAPVKEGFENQRESAPEDAWIEIVDLQRALARALPDENPRLAYLLHRVEGLTVREIAEAMDEPAGRVRWWIELAHKRLKDTEGEPEKERSGVFLGFGSLAALEAALRRPVPISPAVGARVWARVQAEIARIDAEEAADDGPSSGLRLRQHEREPTAAVREPSAGGADSSLRRGPSRAIRRLPLPVIATTTPAVLLLASLILLTAGVAGARAVLGVPAGAPWRDGSLAGATPAQAAPDGSPVDTAPPRAAPDGSRATSVARAGARDIPSGAPARGSGGLSLATLPVGAGAGVPSGSPASSAGAAGRSAAESSTLLELARRAAGQRAWERVLLLVSEHAQRFPAERAAEREALRARALAGRQAF
jgi:RNA polymerase sigma-70 factor (ECF subfamily)